MKKLLLLLLVATSLVADEKVYTVDRVVDGDTIQIKELATKYPGSDGRVRLLGVRAPNIGGNQARYQLCGDEATAAMKKFAEGKKVVLQVHGKSFLRPVAYVWLEDETLLNTLIIESGYARAQSTAPLFARWQEFKIAEESAKDDNLGLWADPVACDKSKVK